MTGREAGGAACIGCRAYQPNGTGRSWCDERERHVFATYRGACGLYEFHTQPRREDAAANP